MNKNFKAENPCNMDLLSRGGGGNAKKVTGPRKTHIVTLNLIQGLASVAVYR